MSLGQILKGDRITSSTMDFDQLPKEFRQTESVDPNSAGGSFAWESGSLPLCERTLNTAQVAALRQAIDEW